MIRNLKVLGLALVAMLAMGAMASAASAAEFHSDSPTGSTWLTGETNTTEGVPAVGTTHVFDAAGSTITCRHAKFEGTAAAKTVTTIQVKATYGGCTVHVGGFSLAATVNMNGCEYQFTSHGVANVVSAAGKNCATEPITYRVSNFLGECDVKVGPQTGLSKVTYDGSSTSSSTADVVVTPAVTGIKGTSAGNLCSTTGEFTNGQYTQGATTVKGFVDNGGKEEGQTAIWVA